MDHVIVSVNGAIVFDNKASADQQAAPAIAGSTDPVQVFNWDQVGAPINIHFLPGVTYSFAYDVPIGYTGTVQHGMIPKQDPSSPDTVDGLHMWESESVAGVPIPGTDYAGQWLTGGPMPAGGFTPSGGRRYYFNVEMGTEGVYGVRQNH